MLDYLIINGEYPNFDSAEIKKGNIGIENGKISYIGQDKPETDEVIDAEGLIVSPGFIDIHMHEEEFEKDGLKYFIAQMMLEQGVTTAMGGNCGHQRQRLSFFKNAIKELGGSPINYLMQAGYNHFRELESLGHFDEIKEEQQDRVIEKLKEEIDEGAWGVSFGIEYDPGMKTEDIIDAIKRTANDPHMFCSAHYREDNKKAIEAIKEMIEIADKTEAKFQISHLSSCSAMGQMEEALQIINSAMEKNPGLNYDTYPYNAFSTHIGSTVFDPGCFEDFGKTYSDIMLMDDPYKNMYMTEEMYNDARENYPTMLAVAFVMNEDEIRNAIVNKNGMVASDGLVRNDNGHPRAAGTFPRVLGKYVREERALSLIDALRKMTLEPAKRLELDLKGRIKQGCDADITIFNPNTIMDGATFQDIHIKPTGIEYVFVAGKLAMDHNEVVNNRLGRFIPFSERHEA